MTCGFCAFCCGACSAQCEVCMEWQCEGNSSTPSRSASRSREITASVNTPAPSCEAVEPAARSQILSVHLLPART